MSLLALDEVHTYYEQSHVLQGVTLEVGAGQVVSLLGRNGAGKSTTLCSIMGIVPARNGSVRFAESEITGLPSWRIARKGIAYVPETRAIFPSLSVLENLTLAARGSGEGGWNLKRVYELFPRLHERSYNGGAQLSGGEQQMLSIARALMLNPRMLVLDEPTEGLAPVVIEEIAAVLMRLKDEGMTMLLVEQNYPFATALSDNLYVLGKGRIRWQGSSEMLEQAAHIKHTWLGV